MMLVVMLVVITGSGDNASVVVGICHIQRVQIKFAPYWRGGYGRQVGAMAFPGTDVKNGGLDEGAHR